MKIGDLVEVIAGAYKGRRAHIIALSPFRIRKIWVSFKDDRPIDCAMYVCDLRVVTALELLVEAL